MANLRRPDPGYRCPFCHAGFYGLDDGRCPWCSKIVSEKHLRQAAGYALELPVWAGEQPMRPTGKGRKRFPRWKPDPGQRPKPDALPTLPLRIRVFDRDEHCCVFCGSRDALTLDHVIPRSRGGSNGFDNLQAACAPCNRRKRNLLPDEPGWPTGFSNARPGRRRG